MKMLLGRIVHFWESVGGDNWLLCQVRWNVKLHCGLLGESVLQIILCLVKFSLIKFDMFE
jgi:hypothetical protein